MLKTVKTLETTHRKHPTIDVLSSNPKQVQIFFMTPLQYTADVELFQVRFD
jgi:hypothetical protein